MGHLETSDYVYGLAIASPTLSMKNHPWKGVGQSYVTRVKNFTPSEIFLGRLRLDTSNVVYVLAV